MKYSLDECLGFRLRRLSRIADGYVRDCLTEYDITENQLTILFTLKTLGKVEQGQIGLTLGLERSTISRNVKLLEARGLIARTHDYRPEIELTIKGEKMVEEIRPLWEGVMDTLIDKIGDSGLKQIANLEKKLK